jgi:hypothetical protein
MTEINRGRPRPAPLNLAALAPALPPVILPNGREVAVRPMTARAYELYRELTGYTAAFQRGEDVDEGAYLDLVDECLALVLPDATPDDLASLGVRIEFKMAPILMAAGRVDEVMRAMAAQDAGTEGNGETLPGLPHDTTSAASSLGTPKRSGRTGRASGRRPISPSS